MLSFYVRRTSRVTAPKEYFCAICGLTRNLTEHHIHPKQFRESYPGGPSCVDDWANLVLLCMGCHSAVHDKRSFKVMKREIRQKLRRKDRDRENQDENATIQSRRDRRIQRLTWEHLLQVLENPMMCEHIESYRRIIRMVERIHKFSWHKTLYQKGS